MDLQPVNFQETNLHVGLTRLIRKFQAHAETKINVNSKGEVVDLPSETCYHVYHIVQEALTNTLKHAAASTVVITLHFLPSAVNIIVSDNGQGFEIGKIGQTHQPDTHHGLQNMLERSKLIGAKMEIKTEISRGTSIFLSIETGVSC